MSIPRIVLIILAVEVAMFIAASISPLDAADQNALATAYQQQTQSLNGTSQHMVIGIFTNNLRITIFDSVPILGFLSFTGTTITAGQVLAAISPILHVSPATLDLVLFIFPHALLEFSAYAIAFTVGLTLTVNGIRSLIAQKRMVDFKVLGVMFIAAICLLILAAAVEVIESLNILVGLALWLPVAIGIIYLRRVLKGLQKNGNSTIVVPVSPELPEGGRCLKQPRASRVRAGDT